MFSAGPPHPQLLLGHGPASMPVGMRLSACVLFAPPSVSLPAAGPPYPYGAILFVAVAF